jgi:hypothetical protein
MKNIDLPKLKDAFCCDNLFVGTDVFGENLIPNITGNDKKAIKNINALLATRSVRHNMDKIVLFHGTAKKHNISNEGVKRTTSQTRRSIQSRPGRVSVSLYPDHAKLFASLGYPNEEVEVYAVCVPFFSLIADTDQLSNRRRELTDTGNAELASNIKNSLAYSFLHGSGAWLKRDVEPYEVRPLSLFMDNDND